MLTTKMMKGSGRPKEAGQQRARARTAAAATGGDRTARSIAATPGRFLRRGGAAWRGGENGVVHLLRGGLGRRRFEGDGGGHGGHGARFRVWRLERHKRERAVGEAEGVVVVHIHQRELGIARGESWCDGDGSAPASVATGEGRRTSCA